MNDCNSILHDQPKGGNIAEKNDVTMTSHTTKMISSHQVPVQRIDDDEHRSINGRRRSPSTSLLSPSIGTAATASADMIVDGIGPSNRKVSLDLLDRQQQQQQQQENQQQRCCRVLPLPGAVLSQRPPSSTNIDNTKEKLQTLPIDKAYDGSMDDLIGGKDDDGDDDAFMTGCDFNSSLPTHMDVDDPRSQWTFRNTTEAGPAASPPPVSHQGLPVMPINSNMNDTNTLNIPPLWTTRIRDRTDDGSKYVDGLDTLVLPPLDDGRHSPYVQQLQSDNCAEVYGSAPRRELFHRGQEQRNRGEEEGREDFAFASRLKRKTQPAPFVPRDLFRPSSW